MTERAKQAALRPLIAQQWNGWISRIRSPFSGMLMA